jgi:hypothetical protein
MANTIGYGQGAVNNTNAWGQGAKVGSPSFSNTYSTDYDGIDAYISTDSTYSELDGQSKMTLSLWMKPISGAPLYEYVVTVPRNTTANEHVFSFQHFENNYLSFSIDSRTTRSVQARISSITYGSWNHILCVLDATLSGNDRMRIYVNGVDETYQANIGTFTSLQNSTGSLFIGEEPQFSYNPYKGLLDEVAIWSGTDLRNDVSTLYNSGVPGNLNDNGLTAPTSWYRFEEGSGTTIADSGSSTNNATIQNEVTFETDVPT